MIDNTFIQSPEYQDYLDNKEEISKESVVFVEDKERLITQGKEYQFVPSGGNEGLVLQHTENGVEWQTIKVEESPFEKGKGTNSAQLKDVGLDDETFNDARGLQSVALGSCNITTNSFETAVGFGNNSSSTSETIFTVGNGVDRGDGDGSVIRHNALEVLKDGTIRIPDTSANTAIYSKPMFSLQEKLKTLENNTVDVSTFIETAKYNEETQEIEFYHGENKVATLDATPFIVDNFVKEVEIIGENIVITFNTEDKPAIKVPITKIFNPLNYYTKLEIDNKLNWFEA